MLFPESRRALEMFAEETPVWAEDYDVVAAREQARALAAQEPREDVAEVEDVDADGVPARLYTPEGASGTSIVHVHGGGFVFNDVEVHDASARRLANRSGMRVLSVDYRRPPEHKFPAPVDDVSAAGGWAQRTLDGPLLAHGDSAGGNLALVDALRHPGRYAALALIYPFLDPTAGFESYRTHADGFDPREGAWYWEQYATSADHSDPDLAPLLSDRLGTLPPTLVVTAEHDPLRDEGEELARRIVEAGVEVVATRYLGQLHGFWRHPRLFPSAEPLVRQVAGFLRQHG
ncbi:alpha/beta hydrolase fold domain-containing protein [Nocardioides sp. MAH-18]|uniref:Alpha/beta hydrolase fold domain-containing protein n=1 Tax=Nocardioides agri TaxID=2682843 RepID=A0A6L6XWR0_9ACTN|nr:MULTISPECIES: alpha/beta hydrolase [unclassified Nocardioides]MBA2956389.1 alpha/beta hydrolase [Nocardioides sp. CGMCC 1.13656]MVQ51232.1 alpha/beta hydrolase fold domain-containing protein [Nocardioides sp. MAH-18]